MPSGRIGISLLTIYMLLVLYHFGNPLLGKFSANGENQHDHAGNYKRDAEQLTHGQPTAPQIAQLHIGFADEFDQEAERAVEHEEQAAERAAGTGRGLAREDEHDGEQHHALEQCFIELGGMAHHFARGTAERNTPRQIGGSAPQLAVDEVGATAEEQPDGNRYGAKIGQREVRDMRERRESSCHLH